MGKRKNKENLLEAKREEEHFDNQMLHNSKLKDFEYTSINTLILEILTRLTGTRINNKKYIEDMPTDCIHQYIQDLNTLFNIRKHL